MTNQVRVVSILNHILQHAFIRRFDDLNHYSTIRYLLTDHRLKYDKTHRQG